MRSRLTALLTALALSVALGVVGAPAAQADVPCVIDDFTPRSVVVGLAPVVRTFAVRTSGCSLGYWKAESDLFYAYEEAAQQTIDPRSNAEAGTHDVVVHAWNDYFIGESRDLPDSFSLLRRTTWQAKSVDASPEPARRGSPITVTGRLLIVDWTNDRYVPYAGRSIALEFRTATGSYARVKTVTDGCEGLCPHDGAGRCRDLAAALRRRPGRRSGGDGRRCRPGGPLTTLLTAELLRGGRGPGAAASSRARRRRGRAPPGTGRAPAARGRGSAGCRRWPCGRRRSPAETASRRWTSSMIAASQASISLAERADPVDLGAR